MNKARKFLVNTASLLELPADVLAGVPKIEVVGFRECSIEPHKGLLEYEKEQIIIETELGKVCILGSGLTIKLMNSSRITVRGQMYAVELQEGGHG